MFRMIGRHFKEAFQGMFRHFGMAVSCVMAMTFMLLLVSLLTLTVGNVTQISRSLQHDVQVFVKVENYVDESMIPTLQERIMQVDGVSEVEYSSRDQELDRYIKSFGDKGEMFEIYREDNPLSRAFLVNIKEGYSISEVSRKIGRIDGLSEVDFGGATTEDFMTLLEGIRKGGYLIVLAMTLLAIFLISNTIKITIYNRNREISIMRQVGASNSYIRQPFVIEGILLGIIGSFIPVAVSIFGYKALFDRWNGQLISGMLPLQPVNPFAYQVAGFLVMVAIVIGFVGSYISVNKYLRWRR